LKAARDHFAVSVSVRSITRPPLGLNSVRPGGRSGPVMYAQSSDGDIEDRFARDSIVLVLDGRSISRTRDWSMFVIPRPLHDGIGRRAVNVLPCPAEQPPGCGTIVEVPHVGGLHHHYECRAA
jgi:hypothetical protein